VWSLDEQMQTFKALSYGDKLRVSRSVTRGEAPANPRMAAAAVELAESCQRQSWGYTGVMRWGPIVLLVIAGCNGVLDATDGNALGLILNVLIAVISVLNFLLSPATRPKNMAQALEASRRVVLAESAGLAPNLKEGVEYVEDLRRADAERLSQLEP
jgi:hypothetical protein